MGRLFLEVVTPAKVLTSQEVDMVIAPGAEGEFGVLPGHINFLSGIVPGELRYDDGGKRSHMFVSSGFAEVSADKVSVLVDSAEKATDIDLNRAQRAMERAKERLAKDRTSEEIDFLRVEAALQRAITRIKVAKKSQ
jgi:F-type H+-transporting ATPase subunit epsilon